MLLQVEKGRQLVVLIVVVVVRQCEEEEEEASSFMSPIALSRKPGIPPKPQTLHPKPQTLPALLSL